MHVISFHDLLLGALEGRPDHPAIVELGTSRSYRELERESALLAGQLATLGVRRGDRVVLHLRSYVDEVTASFAIARLGAVFVNVHYQWTAAQLLHVLGDCGARVLITDPRKAQPLTDKLPDSLETILYRGGTAPEGAPGWVDGAGEPAPVTRVIDTDLSALLYTSGSTGKPKGVMLSHRNLVSGARTVATYVSNTPDDRVLGLLPLCFDYGLNQLTTMCLVGGTVVAQKVVMPAEIVATLKKEAVTGFAAVPPVWVDTVRLLATRSEELPALRYVTNSGGAIPQDVLQRMPEVFPGVEIFLMYGLTEAFRSTFLPPEDFHRKMGAMGGPVPNVETYIVDRGIGVCGPGQQGELVHRGSLISLGYWGNIEATAEKIRPCPELHSLIGDEPVVYSGDLIRIDDEGCYWFVGRMDGMIKSSGFRISPTEVEEGLFTFAGVQEAVAFGVKDDRLGEAVMAAVASDGTTLDEATLLEHCRKTLPAYMVPSKIYLLSEPMPRTASGKIDRPKVIRGCTD